MTKICLVRHGETDWNIARILQGQQNVPLNTTGRKQAQATGNYFKKQDIPFDLMITSPLGRAKETAVIINQQLQLPLIEVDAFAERAFGKAEGMSPEDRERDFPEAEFPGQEVETAFHERVIEGFKQLSTEYENQHLLIISHGLVIQLILQYLEKETINYKQTPLLNGCISNISLQNNIWHVENINQTAHLK